MQLTKHLTRDVVAAQHIFNTATAAVAGLCLATHSVTVTAIGAAASTLATCWFMWLTGCQGPNHTQPGQLAEPHE
jgi:hypothetical protein